MTPKGWFTHPMFIIVKMSCEEVQQILTENDYSTHCLLSLGHIHYLWGLKSSKVVQSVVNTGTEN